jgi:hypothetical protein
MLIAVGCGQESALRTPAEDDLLLTPDTPLVVRLNDKSQMWIDGRWVDLFGQQSIVKNYFRRQAGRFQQMCTEYGEELIKCGPNAREWLPTQVFIEIEPKTKVGSISYVERIAKEFGFGRFQVVKAGYAAEELGLATNLPPAPPLPTQPD